MNQLIGMLKSEKVSASIILSVGLAAWWLYGWAQTEFVTRDDYGELKVLIVKHVEDMQIVNASQLVRDKELALQIAEGTGEPLVRTNQLEEGIKEARAYRECLMHEKPNCKHLKPLE